MDEVKIITEHRDELATRLQKLLTTEVKSLSPTRGLLQTSYSAAKAPLGKCENNERPQAANKAAGIDRDLLCPLHTNAVAPDDYVSKWMDHDQIPEFKARRLSGYNHFLAHAQRTSELTNIESQLKTEFPGAGAGYIPMRQPLDEPLIESIDLPPLHSRVTRLRDAAWTFSLQQAMNTIPLFDGNPDLVAFFCRVVRNVLTYAV